MSKARTKKQRINQVTQWLHAQHPCRYEVLVKWVDDITTTSFHLAGDADFDRYTIRLSEKVCRYTNIATETLMHEWAHLLVNSERHTDKFWTTYGRVYRSFYEDGGDTESERY